MTEGGVQETANNGKNGMEMPEQCDQHHSAHSTKTGVMG